MLTDQRGGAWAGLISRKCLPLFLNRKDENMEITNMIKLGALGFKPDDIRKIKDSGIKSDEIIELAKSGYTPGDVDELIKLASEESASQPEEETDEKGPESRSETPGEEDASDDKKEPDPRDKEIEDLKKQIEKMQDKNASQNLGDPKPQKTNREKVQEALRNLY